MNVCTYVLLADKLKLHSGIRILEGAYKWYNAVFENYSILYSLYSMEMGDSSKYVITIIDGLHRIINIDNYYEQTFRLAKKHLTS